MPHVGGRDLAKRQALIPNDAAKLALTLIEAAICPGVPDVLTWAEREVILSIPVYRDLRRVTRISCLELGAWPITGVTSFIGSQGTDYTTDAKTTRFSIYLPLVSSDTDVTIRFVTGYEEDDLPAPLKAAAVQLGLRLLEGDLDISKMSWDTGLSADYVGATAEMLPASVRELIAPWTFGSFG